MTFVGTYWYVWLIGFFSCMGYVVGNQVARMKRMLDNPGVDGFKRGLGLFAFASVGATFFGVLLAISIVAQIVIAVNK